jgi:hypothetical protein
MRQTIIWAISLVLCVATTIYQVYLIKNLDAELIDQKEQLEKKSAELYTLQTQIDSLEIQNIALGKSVIYLDSCQQIRTTKTDRAERRGKFVGGLLKSLFPSL